MRTQAKSRAWRAVPGVLVALAGIGLAASLVLLEPPAHAQGVAQHDFVGAERCRACHQKEYESWSRGPHARALDALSAAERKDARCLTCHTMAPEVDDPELGGIQCETCHGAGKWYSKAYIMRDKELRAALGFVDPDEKTCLRCHTETSPSIRPWMYEEKREAIRHWSEDVASAPSPTR